MLLLFFFFFVSYLSLSSQKVIPPAFISQFFNLSTPFLPFTDSATIARTASLVSQKSGALGYPNHPVSKTIVTAVDGTLLVSTRDLSPRSVSDYDLVFNGTGLSPTARDAAIQGTAYLTYTLVPNSTYNVDDCLRFCDSVPACTFANLYYEFTTPPSSDPSNLKCVLYADVHSADEKTFWGNHSYIQQSSGWSAKSSIDPATPQGYDFVFGPANAANNAPAYMGFVFLDRYDVAACAQECNNRTPDPVGGACQYFNIWRAVVNGVPTTYSCSMYFHPTDSSTATNTGHSSLKITLSRGYRRTNYIVDGSFEAFPPSSSPPASSCPFTFFCYLPSSATWTGLSPPTGTLDATIFLYQPLAHFGITFGLLGSVTLADSLAGTLTPSSPLHTLPGKNYIIGFFHMSSYSDPELEAPAFVDVLWNGKVVKTLKPGWSTWTYYSVLVVGKGQDEIAFHGGSAPAWSFIDDVSVFEA